MAGPSTSQLANSLSGGSLSELRKRIFFLIGALIVFRIGTFIPVPGIDISVMRELFDQQRTGILGMFNMFSGGALERMSILALGIMPYISASIIMQLMTVAVPTLEQLKKEGESGRRKITQYTRYGTVVLATFQSIGISIALSGQSSGGGPPIRLKTSVSPHRPVRGSSGSQTFFPVWSNAISGLSRYLSIKPSSESLAEPISCEPCTRDPP